MSKSDFRATRRSAIVVSSGTSSSRPVTASRAAQFQSRNADSDGSHLLKKVKKAKRQTSD